MSYQSIYYMRVNGYGIYASMLIPYKYIPPGRVFIYGSDYISTNIIKSFTAYNLNKLTAGV
jgi:hypothetical protein